MSLTSSESSTSRDIVGAFGYALVAAVLFNAVLVIVKETNPSIMALMSDLTGHHWISHGLMVLLVFGSLGLLLAWPFPVKADSKLMAMLVAIAVVASSGIVLVFFLARAFL